MEENLYKAPEANIRDLTISEMPVQLKRVLNLIKGALLLAVLQTVLGFVLEPDILMLDDEISFVFLLTMAGFLISYFFLVYYLCLYRPVKGRKRTAARWLFWTALVMSVLGLYIEFINDDSELQVSLAENILSTIEMLIIFYAAYLLTRPEYKVHLIN